MINKVIKQKLHRLTNGIRYAAIGGSGSAKHQSGFALYGILLHHIFAVAGMLRIPLSQLQKRRIPRTLCEIRAKLLGKFKYNVTHIGTLL